MLDSFMLTVSESQQAPLRSTKTQIQFAIEQTQLYQHVQFQRQHKNVQMNYEYFYNNSMMYKKGGEGRYGRHCPTSFPTRATPPDNAEFVFPISLITSKGNKPNGALAYYLLK